jgi:Fe-S oxidoreductase
VFSPLSPKVVANNNSDIAAGGVVMAVAEVTQNSMSSETFFTSLYEVPDGERIRACLQCGSCSGVCPYGFAMNYPPRAIIAALRADDLTPVIENETIWLCVSCFACSHVCPAQIPLTNGLLMRLKSELLLRGKAPTELITAMANSRRYGNALGESPRKRAEWTQDLSPAVPILARLREPVELLWYVGDYASYHPRVQRVSQAMAKILQALNIKFGILGPEEQSDGDAQLLAGERGLFEMLAMKNARAINKYEFNEIVTTDPHAYNVIKNEYPALGFPYPVKHYTQFLAERLDQLGPLLKREQPYRVTYHDPCALGRAHNNDIYDEPRQILEAIPGLTLVEMPHNRDKSICCGGGGGGMWLDGFSWEQTHTRTSDWRIAEALGVHAQVLAVACPYETPRFEDAVKSTGHEDELVVKDIAELLADALDG